jgi:hypothetical protein
MTGKLLIVHKQNMRKPNPICEPEKFFRATLMFAVNFKTITILRARNAEEAKKRALEALEETEVMVDLSDKYHMGGIVGVSEPTDAEVHEIRESPDGLLHLDNKSGPQTN